MSTDDNKAVTRRSFEEGWNQGKVDVFDELFAPTFSYHDSTFRNGLNTQGYKQLVMAMRHAFPDLQITIDNLIAEGDQVAVRLTLRGTQTGDLMTAIRIPATGRQVTELIIAFIRFIDGKAGPRPSLPVSLFSQGSTSRRGALLKRKDV